MRISTLSATMATMAAVVGVSALPQRMDPINAALAPTPDFDAWQRSAKPIVALSDAEIDEQFVEPSKAKLQTGFENLMAFAPAASADMCNSASIRPEWDLMNDADRGAFVGAIQCLMSHRPSGNYPGSTNRYEDLASVHQTLTNDIHRNDIFLIWHRFFLWTFADILRTECGYNNPIPWWDETRYANKFNQASIFTPAFFGSLTPGQSCVTDGPFANNVLTLHIGPGFDDTDHCLLRDFHPDDASGITQDAADKCRGVETFREFAGCIEYGPHARGHNAVGGVMADAAASPSDPVFFLHHSFVDRLYWNWQMSGIGRNGEWGINGIQQDNHGVQITPDYVLPMHGLRDDMTVRDALDTMSTRFCYKYDY